MKEYVLIAEINERLKTASLIDNIDWLTDVRNP
jgi:hypothetical protein